MPLFGNCASVGHERTEQDSRDCGRISSATLANLSNNRHRTSRDHYREISVASGTEQKQTGGREAQSVVITSRHRALSR